MHAAATAQGASIRPRKAVVTTAFPAYGRWLLKSRRGCAVRALCGNRRGLCLCQPRPRRRRSVLRSRLPRGFSRRVRASHGRAVHRLCDQQRPQRADGDRRPTSCTGASSADARRQEARRAADGLAAGRRPASPGRPKCCELGGKYLLYYTASDSRKNAQCVGVAVAADPLGPFVDERRRADRLPDRARRNASTPARSATPTASSIFTSRMTATASMPAPRCGASRSPPDGLSRDRRSRSSC